jgi:hypothetical protein
VSNSQSSQESADMCVGNLEKRLADSEMKGDGCTGLSLMQSPVITIEECDGCTGLSLMQSPVITREECDEATILNMRVIVTRFKT